MIQVKRLTFEGKKSGSVEENPNVGMKNGVEFTQTEYDEIFSSELRNTETDKLEFEFPVPDETKVGLQYVQIYYKSKMDSGENELRSSDKGVYNDDTTTYKQKMLQVQQVDIVDNVIKFNVTTTGVYGIYEVVCDVTYDDAGLNNYGGNYTYVNETGQSVTVDIVSKKLEEITKELEGLPVNSVANVTFAQVSDEIINALLSKNVDKGN